jgi:perosamine synthetase
MRKGDMTRPPDASANGGSTSYIPYGKQWLDEEDLQAVIDALRSDFITTGPRVADFEKSFAELTSSRHAVAVSSGTAALHSAMFALGVKPGDEVIVPTMTFAATANSVAFQGATPVFADVDAETLLIDPGDVEAKISSRTVAVVAVDFAGQPCDYDRLSQITERRGLALVADACHALGASYRGKPVGSLGTLSVFSFHPVKHITTGEGGMITANDANLAGRLRRFRNHGITSDFKAREMNETWYYEMVDLGYNYRITDFQCALGFSQLRKLPRWVKRRQEIARLYDEIFRDEPAIAPLAVREDVSHAYHLYVIRLSTERLPEDRAKVFAALRRRGIGVNVHYIPVHLHPYYRERYGTVPGMCPVAENAYQQILSLPMFPRISDEEVITVARSVVLEVRNLAS